MCVETCTYVSQKSSRVSHSTCTGSFPVLTSVVVVVGFFKRKFWEHKIRQNKYVWLEYVTLKVTVHFTVIRGL